MGTLWATVDPFFVLLLWQMMVLAKIILSEEKKALTDNVALLKGWISMSYAPNSPDLNPEVYNI